MTRRRSSQPNMLGSIASVTGGLRGNPIGGWIKRVARKRAKKGLAPINNRAGHQMPSQKPITLASLPKPRSS